MVNFIIFNLIMFFGSFLIDHMIRSLKTVSIDNESQDNKRKIQTKIILDLTKNFIFRSFREF